MNFEDVFKTILKDLKIELDDEFDRNFEHRQLQTISNKKSVCLKGHLLSPSDLSDIVILNL